MDAALDSRISAAAARVRGQLSQLGTERHRTSLQRFFQEPVRCHGVPAASVRELGRQLWREVREWPAEDRNRLCDELWEGGEVENGSLACYLLGRFAKKLGEAEFGLCERWAAQRVHNWAHCDAVSTIPVAACIVNRPELAARVAEWATAPGRWQRRAAAVSLVKEARSGRQLGLIFRVADALRADSDGMVQKGTGWLLKEAYPGHPDEVVRFLLNRPEPFPRLVLRYAAEKMSPADRKRVLLS